MPERWRARHGRFAGAVLLVTMLLLGPPASAADWELVSRTDALEIESRSQPGSAVRTLRARGLIDAPPRVVRAVIADVDRYAEFMPYVKESRTLAVEGDVSIVYQRLSFGFLGVSDRDYVLRIVETAVDESGAQAYTRWWNVGDSAQSPPQSSVVRVSINRGYWRLGPDERDPGRTRAVYCLFTDPGGQLPAWIVNQANTIAIPKLFAAVTAATAERRYADAAAPARGVAPDAAALGLVDPCDGG